MEQLGKKNNKLPKKDIRETAPFTVALKRIKYLGINLSKKVKDSYTENYKRLVKEIKEHTKKDSPCLWTGLEDLILFKCPYNPDQCNPYQNPNSIVYK